jgi:O-antigen/teichoic acid export membrane protein
MTPSAWLAIPVARLLPARRRPAAPAGPARVMAEAPGPVPGLAHATSTGVRVMGLWILKYLAAFAATVLIARALGPAGRGLYAYPAALLGIMVALAHIGLEFAQIYLAGQGRDLRRMWADATLLSVVLGALCCAGLALVIIVYPRASGGLPLAWLAVPAGIVPFQLMNLYWASLLQLGGRLVRAAWATWCGAAVQAAAVAVLYVRHELTPFRVLLLLAMMNGATWLLLLLACRQAGLVTVRVDTRLLRESVAVSVKAYGAQTTFFLVLRADQVLVRAYAGYGQLGLYAFASTIAELLWLLTDPLSAALVPHQVRASAREGRRLSFAMARRSLWILLTTAVLAWLLAPFAVRVVYGPEFVGAVPALRLLLPGVVALGATRPLRSMLLKEGRAVALSVLGFSALGANVALNILLLPRIGIRGASIASSLCYAALAVTFTIMARRHPGPRDTTAASPRDAG